MKWNDILMVMMIRKTIVYGSVILFCVMASTIVVYADEPEFIFSWKAHTGTPYWYEGRKFPSYNSYIDVTFEIVEQNGSLRGNLIDLSKKEIRWYLNNDLVRKGEGLNHIRIHNKDYPGKSVLVRISVVDYYDAALGKSYNVDYYKYIPIVYPQVVVDYGQFNRSVLPGQDITFVASPFFFNGSQESLNVTWSVDGKVIDIDPQHKYFLSISVPNDAQKNYVFSVGVSANSPGELFSSASFFEKFLLE